MNDQTGRVVLVTGCSSGIGRATAQYLAQRGWRVFASARRLDDIRDLQSEQVAILQLDVTDETSRVRAIDQVVTQAGRLDALVNNAGVNMGGPLELLPLEDARELFETNVWGALRLSQLAVRVMREQGAGRIVNMTSIIVRVPLPFQGLYCASKSALDAISDTLRWELSPWNIHVSVVAPGIVKTNIRAKALAERLRFAAHPLYARFLKTGAKTSPAAQRATTLSGLKHRIRQVFVSEDPLETVQVIERALTDKHPRARYNVGFDTHVYDMIHWLVPGNLYEYGIRRFYGLQRFQASRE